MFPNTFLEVPHVFAMFPNTFLVVPHVFAMFPNTFLIVPHVFAMFPNTFLIAPLFDPICFGKWCPPLTYMGILKISILAQGISQVWPLILGTTPQPMGQTHNKAQGEPCCSSNKHIIRG
jgi:hypothetical protein